MAVMGTFCEVMAPSKPPTKVPTMIQSQALESMPLVLRKLISTPSTAKAIATAASWLAARAERTLDSLLMPNANSRTATSSMAYLITTAAVISASPSGERVYG